MEKKEYPKRRRSEPVNEHIRDILKGEADNPRMKALCDDEVPSSCTEGSSPREEAEKITEDESED